MPGRGWLGFLRGVRFCPVRGRLLAEFVMSSPEDKVSEDASRREDSGDARLVALEAEWLRAWERAAAPVGAAERERRDWVVDRLEERIAATPAGGLAGVAVKLAVCAFHAGRDWDRPHWAAILDSALKDCRGLLP